MIRGETQTVGGPITYLVTCFEGSNSFSLTWSWHFLPMIFMTFLGPTWRVVPSIKMSMLSRSVRFDGQLGRMIQHNALERYSKKPCWFCCLGLLARTAYFLWLSRWSCSFGSTTVVDQGLPILLVELAFSDFWITPPPPSYVWQDGIFGSWTHAGHVIKSYELTVPRDRLMITDRKYRDQVTDQELVPKMSWCLCRFGFPPPATTDGVA